MKRVTLTGGLEVSPIGFGCCPMGGWAWGDVQEKELIDAVHVALDNGVNFFDTADVYGQGESERVLGKALKGRRRDAVIATKFGVRLDPVKGTHYDNSARWIDETLDASLKRLGIDCIDLYQIHNRQADLPIEAVFETLERKKEQGKIRCYGLSNPIPGDLESRAGRPSTFQIEYSLAKRTFEPQIEQGIRAGIDFMSWGSLGQGVLSGKYGPDTHFEKNDRRSRPTYMNFYGDKLKDNLAIVEEMRRISAETGKSLTQIAIRWILDHAKAKVVLVGIKRPEQLLQNLGAVGWSLSASQLRSLDRISSG